MWFVGFELNQKAQMFILIQNIKIIKAKQQ